MGLVIVLVVASVATLFITQSLTLAASILAVALIALLWQVIRNGR